MQASPHLLGSCLQSIGDSAISDHRLPGQWLLQQASECGTFTGAHAAHAAALEACMRHDAAALEAALTSCSSPEEVANAYDMYGNTPLLQLSWLPHARNAGPTPADGAHVHMGPTDPKALALALRAAVMAGCVRSAQALIAAGADASTSAPEGETLLHVLVGSELAASADDDEQTCGALCVSCWWRMAWTWTCRPRWARAPLHCIGQPSAGAPGWCAACWSWGAGDSCAVRYARRRADGTTRSSGRG